MFCSQLTRDTSHYERIRNIRRRNIPSNTLQENSIRLSKPSFREIRKTNYTSSGTIESINTSKLVHEYIRNDNRTRKFIEIPWEGMNRDAVF